MEVTTTERTVEVRVYQYGLLKLCEWCESETDAADIVAMWSTLGGVRCETVPR